MFSVAPMRWYDHPHSDRNRRISVIFFICVLLLDMVDTSFNPGFQTKPSIEAETADRFNIVLKKTTAVTTACRIRYQSGRVPITVESPSQ